jgi:hypothetical protein
METPLETVGWSLRTQSSAGGSAMRGPDSTHTFTTTKADSARDAWTGHVPRHGA